MADCLILPFCCLHIYDLMLVGSPWIWRKLGRLQISVSGLSRLLSTPNVSKPPPFTTLCEDESCFQSLSGYSAFFFFYPHCEKFHAHACEVSWVRRWNYNECNGLGVIDFKFSDLILNSEIKISDCWCCRSPTLQEIVKNVTAKVTETELP